MEKMDRSTLRKTDKVSICLLGELTASLRTRTEPFEMPLMTPTRCYLRELPPELRLISFHFVWSGDVHCTFNVANLDTVLAVSLTNPHRTASLLTTCAVIRHEAEPILYVDNLQDKALQLEND